MAVKLRLKRFGRRHVPFYRLNAMDTRKPRNGTSIEELGTYNPLEKDAAKAIQFKAERVQYWLSVGAQPSQTVQALLTRIGVPLPASLTRKPNKPTKPAPKPPKAAAAAPAAPAAAAETK